MVNVGSFIQHLCLRAGHTKSSKILSSLTSCWVGLNWTFDFHKYSHCQIGALPDVCSVFVAKASFLWHFFKPADFFFLSFSKGQKEHKALLSISTESAIFRVPHVAQISSNSHGWVPGSMEHVICLSRALVPSWTETPLFGRFPCGSLFPPLSGFPVLQRPSGRAHAACLETACYHTVHSSAVSGKPWAFLGG